MLGELESTAEKDADKYRKIWEAFGPVLKEGLYEDHERRAQLLGLCRFASSASDEPRSLKQYVADLKPNQTEIYYLVGESIERLKANPKLEAARARGIEVLLLADPIDAFWTMMPGDYDGKPMKSLSQGDVDFSLVPLVDKDAAPPADAPEADKDVLTAVKDSLGAQVSEVRASQRLTDSAACLVASAGGTRPRARTAARPAGPRQRRQAGARAQHAARYREGACPLDRGEEGERCRRPLRAPAGPGPDPRRRGAARSGGLRAPAQRSDRAGPAGLTCRCCREAFMRWLTVLLALALAPMLAFAQQPEPRGKPALEVRGKYIDQRIAEFIAKHEVPGLAMAIVQAPYIPRSAGYGRASRARRAASTRTMLHRADDAGLHRRGGIPAAGDGQARRARSARQASERPAARLDQDHVMDLLQHAAGIPDYRTAGAFKEGHHYLPAELLALVSPLPLQFQPGSEVRQSATDFALLGMVIERASGMSYHDFVWRGQIEPSAGHAVRRGFRQEGHG